MPEDDIKSNSPNSTGTKKTDKKTMTLRLSPSAQSTIDEISSALGISQSEVVRRALGTEYFLMKANQRGDRLQLVDEEKKVREVVLR